MIYVTFSTVMCLLGFQAPFILIQFGWLVSWIYLRFYKRTTADTPGGIETYGDRSETFAFVHWFPPFIQCVILFCRGDLQPKVTTSYPVGLLSNFAYRVALQLKIVRPFAGSASDLESGYTGAPGGARAEAERRRSFLILDPC